MVSPGVRAIMALVFLAIWGLICAAAHLDVLRTGMVSFPGAERLLLGDLFVLYVLGVGLAPWISRAIAGILLPSEGQRAQRSGRG